MDPFEIVIYYNAHFAAILWSLRKWRKIRSFSDKNKSQGFAQDIKKSIRGQYVEFLILTVSFIPHTLAILWAVRNSIISIGLLESLEQNFTIVSLLILGLIITILHHLEFHKERSKVNSTIDITSIDIFKADNICLYLRSFAEDSYNVRDTMPHLFSNPFFGISESLDSHISKALRKKYKIIKFVSGEKSELDSNMFNIELIENWKEQFPELLSKSNLIIVKPGFSDGLRWEIMKIIEGNYLSKSVFLDTYGPDKIHNLEGQMKDNFFTFLKAEYGFKLSPLPKSNFWNKIFPLSITAIP